MDWAKRFREPEQYPYAEFGVAGASDIIPHQEHVREEIIRRIDWAHHFQPTPKKAAVAVGAGAVAAGAAYALGATIGAASGIGAAVLAVIWVIEK